MLVVKEQTVKDLVTEEIAFDAVEAVFGAMARGDAYNFPVVREAIGYADALYGFKSGFDRSGLALGLKSGGYWPGNAERGLTNHQSTVVLFDADTGRPKALVGGNYLTAVRTAASSAVSIRHLAREESSVLGMIGAGHQSTFQLRAALKQRKFDRIVGWNIEPERLSVLEEVAAEHGIPFQRAELEILCKQADVIITITSCFAPLVMKNWVLPGTHIACMGTDTKGKQEVEAGLMPQAKLFTDEVAQSISIGECQHAYAAGLVREDDITPVGAVINGDHPGRASAEEITLFDGTGVGLQDLAVADIAVDVAVKNGLAQEIDF